MKLYAEGLELIQLHYGDQRAERSQVLLMNHIEEGLAILEYLEVPERVKAAWCIHPLVQNDVPFKCSIDLRAYVIDIAKLYSIYANAALCDKRWDNLRYTVEDQIRHLPTMPKEIAQLLIADKVQNRKDFDRYHKGKHPRSTQLSRYFNSWVTYLQKRLRHA